MAHKGLERFQTVKVQAVVEDEKDEKDEKKEEFDKWELEDAVRTLERAEEVKKDPKLIAAIQPLLEKKVASIKSLKDLRKLAAKSAG